MAVRRDDAEREIWWQCVFCGDDGAIRGWQGSRCDLRTRRLVVQPQLYAVRVDEQILSTLYDI